MCAGYVIQCQIIVVVPVFGKPSREYFCLFWKFANLKDDVGYGLNKFRRELSALCAHLA